MRKAEREPRCAPAGLFGPRSPKLRLALMFIVIFGHERRIGLNLHTKSSGHPIALFFTMSRVDFAGEFSTRGSKNNGGPARHHCG
jgi:hypothetical protein